jgi:hypothetical protein
MTNNVAGFGSYGVQFAKADAGLAKLAPGYMIARNALASVGDVGDGQGPSRNRPPDINQSLYTSYPSAEAAGITQNGTLTPKSPLRRAGTDGKDIGVDFDELQRAMAGQPPRK